MGEKQSYFTEKERYQLEVLLQEKYKPKELAVIFNKCLATIYNEIQRGQVELLNSNLTKYTLYKADVAQRKYDTKKVNKGADYKIGNDFELVYFIETKIIEEKWSPWATIGYIKKHELKFKAEICATTLYNYIHKGLFLNVTVDYLQWKKTYKKRKGSKVATKNIKGRSIEKRPPSVEERTEYGDWEMDTVVSGHNTSNACLLVLTERKTREELIFKLTGKTQKEVVGTLDRLELEMGTEKFTKKFNSITMDNGVEFLDFNGIEQSKTEPGLIRTTTFYCHPYSSWERGSNENLNRLIRRFIPKGSDIGKYTDDQIKHVENWLNNYPRGIFGFLSSREYRDYLGIAA